MSKQTRAGNACERSVTDSASDWRNFRVVLLGTALIVITLGGLWWGLLGSQGDAQGDTSRGLSSFEGIGTDWFAVALTVVLAVVTASLDLRRAPKNVPLHYDEHVCKACEAPVKEVRYWLDGAFVLVSQIMLGIVFWLLLLQASRSVSLAKAGGLSFDRGSLEILVAPLLASAATLMVIFYLGAAESEARAVSCVQTERAQRSFQMRQATIKRHFKGSTQKEFDKEARALRGCAVTVFIAAALAAVWIPLATALISDSPKSGELWLAGLLGVAWAYASVALLFHFRDRARALIASGVDLAFEGFLWFVLIAVLLVSTFLLVRAVSAEGSLLSLRALTALVPLALWVVVVCGARLGYKGRGYLRNLQVAAALSFARPLRSKPGKSQELIETPFDQRSLRQKAISPRAGKLRTIPAPVLGAVMARVRYWDEVQPWRGVVTVGEGIEAAGGGLVDINGPCLESIVFTEGTVVTIELVDGQLWEESCLTVTEPSLDLAVKQVSVMVGNNSIPIRVSLKSNGHTKEPEVSRQATRFARPTARKRSGAWKRLF